MNYKNFRIFFFRVLLVRDLFNIKLKLVARLYVLGYSGSDMYTVVYMMTKTRVPTPKKKTKNT